MRTPSRYLRELWTHLKTEHTSSGRLVAAVAIGVFIGTLPFYGFHFFICLAVAWLFGLNKVTTYLAANISNPLVSPFLIFGSVQLGERILHGRFLPLTVEGLERTGPAGFFASWLAGGVALGALLGLVGGLLTFAATTGRRRRERSARDADPFLATHGDVARRYLPSGRVAHGYVKRKLVLDPVYRALAARVGPDASVLDVGCGRGQFAVFLAVAGPARSVTGLDWDAAKIEMARRAAEGLERLSFEVCDLSRGLPTEPARVDVLLLLDVLHYLEPAAQDALLADLAARLAPSGTLWVRDVDAGAGWRYRVTALEERIFTGVRFNRGAGLHFRPISQIRRVLEAGGLVCEVEPMWKGTPFANVLLTATRRPQADLLLREYVERHNRGVRDGDFRPMLELFDEDAQMRFEGIPFGPLDGRARIRDAFDTNRPSDELVLVDVTPTSDGAVATYAWLERPDDRAGTLTLTASSGTISRLVVTALVELPSPC